MAKSNQLFPGYPFELISKRKRGAAILYSYSFDSKKANSTYIIQAFYYREVNLFVIKFYNKSYKGKNKYAILTNQGDVRSILGTNLALIYHLLSLHPEASFGFMGERSFYKNTRNKLTLVEPMENNQRYRVYKLFVQNTAIQQKLQPSFIQEYIDNISVYLLINRNYKNFNDLQQYEHAIRQYVGDLFPELNFTDL